MLKGERLLKHLSHDFTTCWPPLIAAAAVRTVSTNWLTHAWQLQCDQWFSPQGSPTADSIAAHCNGTAGGLGRQLPAGEQAMCPQRGPAQAVDVLVCGRAGQTKCQTGANGDTLYRRQRWNDANAQKPCAVERRAPLPCNEQRLLWLASSWSEGDWMGGKTPETFFSAITPPRSLLRPTRFPHVVWTPSVAATLTLTSGSCPRGAAACLRTGGQPKRLWMCLVRIWPHPRVFDGRLSRGCSWLMSP